MKKLLSIVLALALLLALGCPAWAAEELDPATAAEIAEKYGLDAPEVTPDVPTGDFGYSIKLPEPLSDDDPTPTLTLCVNGVDTEVAVTAEDGVTYADADALRQFFGPETVPADAAGPLPIRATAEAAGWDVGWYSSWWSGRQEVQLWDKASYEGFLNEEFAPLNEFLAKAMAQSKDLLFSEKATAGHETVTMDLKRFSTLDGDKDYKLTLAVDYIVQNGVMDMTCTFDLSQLLQLFDGKDLTGLTKTGGFTVTQLTQLLKVGKAELIIDYNEGLMAYNVPLLALLDESLAGWQSQYLLGLDTVMESYEEMGEAAFTSSLYAQMLTSAGYGGAEYALEQYDQTVSLMTLFAGKDRFSTQNGKTTYTLTAQAVNEAISRLAADNRYAHFEETPQLSLFKACELTYTLDNGGNVKMSLHIRPDTDGIAEALDAAYDDFYDGGFTDMTTVMKRLLPAWDMDITASASGNRARATEKMDVHWNNVGKLSLRTTTTTQTTTKAPRQVEDVVNAE